MTRPQSGADIKLIKAGLALAKEKGLTGFSVRDLCSKAKVNPGLFHYYFTTREIFNKAVLKEAYGALLKDLEVNIPKNLTPKEKLIAFRALLAGFVKNNSPLLTSVFIDVVSGNKEIFAFIKENFTYHIKLALSIIEECKKEGVVEDADSANILFQFVLPVIIPNIAAGVLGKVLDKQTFKDLKPFFKKITSDCSTEERSALALKAVLK